MLPRHPRVSSRQSLLLVRLSFFSLVFCSPVLKPNFHLKEGLFIMIKIFIELINNFLSDGIYRTGLDREDPARAGRCSGLFAFLVKTLLAPDPALEESDQARTRLA